MTDDARLGRYLGHEISDRQVTQLIGIAQGLVADGTLNDPEIHFLHKWLASNGSARRNPVAAMLVRRLDDVLADGVIDEDERADLMQTMISLTASDFELGEVVKSTSLPLCDPQPALSTTGARYCFTGTFTYGRRKACEAVMEELGAQVGNLVNSTDFLVIGAYATDAWKQENFGRKIEKAVKMRDEGLPIHIVSEAHWRKSLGLS